MTFQNNTESVTIVTDNNDQNSLCSLSKMPILRTSVSRNSAEWSTEPLNYTCLRFEIGSIWSSEARQVQFVMSHSTKRVLTTYPCQLTTNHVISTILHLGRPGNFKISNQDIETVAIKSSHGLIISLNLKRGKRILVYNGDLMQGIMICL